MCIIAKLPEHCPCFIFSTGFFKNFFVIDHQSIRANNESIVKLLSYIPGFALCQVLNNLLRWQCRIILLVNQAGMNMKGQPKLFQQLLTAGTAGCKDDSIQK